MSAIRAAVRPAKRKQRLFSVKVANPKAVKVWLTVALGLVLIQLIHVLMGGFTAAFTYEISDLKAEKRTLSTQSDILSAEVNSLSSNQNLVNVANSLGMVSNVNPVFLRLSDGTVIGKPRRAQANVRTVARNLVPNSAMTLGTNLDKITPDNSSSVLGSSKYSAMVTSGGSTTIQASPTN